MGERGALQQSEMVCLFVCLLEMRVEIEQQSKRVEKKRERERENKKIKRKQKQARRDKKAKGVRRRRRIGQIRFFSLLFCL
jgi:hypothetical protein